LLDLFSPKLVIVAWAKEYTPPPWNAEGRIPFDPDADEEEWMSFGRLILDRKTPQELLTILPAEKTITLSLGEGPRAEQFIDGLNAEIPVEVRGEFVPWKPVIAVGPHDVFDGDMRGLIRVAHAHMSVTMQGQTTPNNAAEYERVVFETNAARNLQAALEAICGPLQHWIGWDT
jgi:hypothetical protein